MARPRLVCGAVHACGIAQAHIDLETDRILAGIDDRDVRIDTFARTEELICERWHVQVFARLEVPRADTPAEAILERQPQQRIGLCTVRGIENAGTHPQCAAVAGLRSGAPLTQLVSIQVPVRRELHAEARVHLADHGTEGGAARERIAVEMNQLNDEEQSQPGAGESPALAEVVATLALLLEHAPRFRFGIDLRDALVELEPRSGRQDELSACLRIAGEGGLDLALEIRIARRRRGRRNRDRTEFGGLIVQLHVRPHRREARRHLDIVAFERDRLDRVRLLDLDVEDFMLGGDFIGGRGDRNRRFLGSQAQRWRRGLDEDAVQVIDGEVELERGLRDLVALVLGFEGQVGGAPVRPSRDIGRQFLGRRVGRYIGVRLLDQERERIEHVRAASAAHASLRGPEHGHGDPKNGLALWTLREQVSDAPRSDTPMNREWRTCAYQTTARKPVSRPPPALQGSRRAPARHRAGPARQSAAPIRSAAPRECWPPGNPRARAPHPASRREYVRRPRSARHYQWWRGAPAGRDPRRARGARRASRQQWRESRSHSRSRLPHDHAASRRRATRGTSPWSGECRCRTRAPDRATRSPERARPRAATDRAGTPRVARRIATAE